MRGTSMSSTGSQQSGCCLWIGDLSPWLDENWLKRMFTEYNCQLDEFCAATQSLVSCKVIRHKTTQMSRGYGFLLFNSHEAANHVLTHYNGKLIPGTDQVFRLNWAANGRQDNSSPTDFSLFVGDLADEVTDFTLQEAFRRIYASVRSAKVMRAPLSGRSRNFGFCRFANEQERDQALLEMNGHEICGRPVRVSLAAAKKTQTGMENQDPGLHSSVTSGSGSQPGSATLFVGGVAEMVTEQELQTMFSLFGKIVSVKSLPSRNCAFVQFSDSSAARAAMTMLQDQVIGGSKIRISWGRQNSAPRNNQPFHANLSTSYLYPGAVLPGAFPARPGSNPLYLDFGAMSLSNSLLDRSYEPYGLGPITNVQLANQATAQQQAMQLAPNPLHRSLQTQQAEQYLQDLRNLQPELPFSRPLP